MAKRQVWINDNSNPKYQKIKASFLEAMYEQSKEQKINYYDFLLVAKKLSFRFEESSHLMALKNYFSKNRNAVLVKKMADLLCISQQSLHVQEQKIIVKFAVPDTQFAPIKQQTHQDEQQHTLSQEDLGEEIFEKMGSNISNEEQKEVNEKIAIILSIKVDQMEKKIRALMGDRESNHILYLLRQTEKDQVNYDEFKQLVLKVLASLRERIKMSEDDIKTIFFVLDTEHKGAISVEQAESIKEGVSNRLREFYRSRINRDMVKNTLFKLGKVKSNAIQIYQVKNASLLQFENIQKAIVQEEQPHKGFAKLKQPKLPHFGPLKGAALANRQRMTVPTHNNPWKNAEPELKLQRERIQKILRVSKQQKRKDKKGETVASKLRSLFIHKVILPRQKMIEQQKERYSRHRGTEAELTIKPSKQ